MSNLSKNWGETIEAAIRGKVTPMNDMGEYTENLYKSFMLPYPAIWNTLGVDQREIKGNFSVRGGKGVLTFVSPAADAKFTITVMPDGTHVLKGNARGAALNQKFKFRAPYPGMHRGTQGDISSFIADQLPAKVVYKVYGVSSRPMVFDNKDDLLRKFKSDGIETGTHLRKELRGQPKLRGLAGPMFDGRKGDVVVVRYDTWELYDQLSR